MDAFLHLASLMLVHVGSAAVEVSHLVHDGFPGQFYRMLPQGIHPLVCSCFRVGMVHYGGDVRASWAQSLMVRRLTLSAARRKRIRSGPELVREGLGWRAQGTLLEQGLNRSGHGLLE